MTAAATATPYTANRRILPSFLVCHAAVPHYLRVGNRHDGSAGAAGVKMVNIVAVRMAADRRQSDHESLMVVTNDDGIDAPGLAALVEAASGFGELLVIAPAVAQSGVGHQLTTESPLRVERLAERRYRVDGKPADCTRLALTHFAPEAGWVLAGINHGANLGSDVYTSGTVAAVREAALLGYRAAAVSQYVGRGRAVDWDVTARRAATALGEIFTRELPPGHFWNVNLPHPPDDADEPAIVFCRLDTRAHAVRYRHEGDVFVYAGDYHTRPRQPGRDVDVCMGGSVAVTLVGLETAATE